MSGGYGKISVNDAFKFSSNTGIVKIISESYGNEPHKFSDRLFNMGLNNKLGLSILGESSPRIPHPNDKNWNAHATGLRSELWTALHDVLCF